MEFSELIRTARLRKEYTQSEVCELVNKKIGSDFPTEHLNQGTLSAWETGRQVPTDVNGTRIATIAEVLGIKHSEVNRVLVVVQSARDAPADYKYAEDIRAWVNRIKHAIRDDDQANIWMLNAEVLPAFSGARPEFEQLWRQNLEAGVNYNLIWDMARYQRRDIFPKLHTYVNELSNSLKKDEASGQVRIQMISPDDKAETNFDSQAIMDEYDKYTLFWSNREESRWTPEWKASRPRDESLSKLLERLDHWRSPIAGRLAVYTSPSTIENETFAGLMLHNVRATMKGPSANRYCWLGDDDVDKLRAIVIRAEKLLFTEGEVPIIKQ